MKANKNALNPALLAPLSILKVWASGFGISLAEHKDEITNVHLAYNRYKHLPHEIIIANLQGKVTESYLNALAQTVQSSVQQLIEQLHKASFFSMTPEEIESYIWGELYTVIFSEIFFYLHQHERYLPSLLQMMSSDAKHHATAVALEYLDNEPQWLAFKETLDYEAKEKLRRWRQDELPSPSKLKSLLSSEHLDKELQQKYFTILLHARFIDSLKKKPGQEPLSHQLFHGIRARHLNLDLRVYPFEEPLVRTDKEKQACMWGYDMLDEWAKARQDFMQGDVSSACKRYSKQLELSVCLGPDEQMALIHCAFMAGAFKGVNGDAPLLKKAKNLAIIYGIEEAHDHISEHPPEPHKKLGDFVKSYEIEQWQRDAVKLFPEAKIDFSQVRPAYLIAIIDDLTFSEPSRKSRIGDSDIRLEQLSQAIQHREYDAIERLVSRAKNLNMGNHTRGHTPLLIALQNYIDTHDEKDASVVTLLLDKISSKPAVLKYILETRTDKKKLTALGLAIESNRPEFVRRLLELGASANLRLSPQLIKPISFALKQVSHYEQRRQSSALAASSEIVELLREYGAQP